MPTTYTFQPDYAVPPGATLKETLEVRGISQADLSARTGISEKTISQIIHGAAPISHDTAEKLDLALGIPARFWNRLELGYREALTHIDATTRFEPEVDWLAQIPVAFLQERRLVDSSAKGAALVREVLRFFGVSNVAAWKNTWGLPAAQFRSAKAREHKPGYVAAWLRMGEIQAQQIEVKPYAATEFRRALDAVRQLTLAPPAEWASKLPAICAAAGVAVVLTREIPGASVSGATRWLTKDKALIQLSLKYKSDDQFWFTFFHEAAHLLLHGKKLVFVEFAESNETTEELEADQFARDFLIPAAQVSRLVRLKNRMQIRAFSAEIGVAPGIVVGRLQREGLAYRSAFNDLKRKLHWKA